ncbi:MAG TPA: MFS transporter [Micromonosporaceae bacterium]|nr:MFS transporter [Micromonosporaceae bacterium]
MVAPVTTPPVATDVSAIQRRTVRLLFTTQVIGGVGVAIGIAVGALLAAHLAGTGLSGVAQSCAVIGGAVIVLPVTRLMRARGRRPGLALAYGFGAVGAVIVVAAAATEFVPLLFLGMFCFGGGTAANLQARYTAVDLAEPARRGRQLSLVVWATTIGAVAGPNLAPLAGSAVAPFNLPRLSGPFAFSAIAFALAAVVLLVFLRPDPLLVSRTLAAPEGSTEPAAAGGAGMRDAVRVVLATPAARLGIAGVAIGHLVMVGVMSMTPVHIGFTHNAADTLRIVGVVLSLHIAGMYAFSPLVGVLTDKIGRRPVILLGITVLLVACAVAGTSGDDTPRLAVGLALIGLGWSGTMVAGSTLLSESVPVSVRPAAQGLSDAVMGVAGATGGALSGVVVQASGFPTLTLLAAIATVPVVALALRTRGPVLREGV